MSPSSVARLAAADSASPRAPSTSRTVSEANRNYGANLIVWDALFGTRFLPGDRLPPTEIGIADMPRFPGGWLAQLASPFRWRAVRQESR